MNVRLHIERLILDGLPVEAAHGPAVQAAVEVELTRLLADGGILPDLRNGGVLAQARGKDLQIRGDSAAPEMLGRRLGAAIYASIGP